MVCIAKPTIIAYAIVLCLSPIIGHFARTLSGVSVIFKKLLLQMVYLETVSFTLWSPIHVRLIQWKWHPIIVFFLLPLYVSGYVLHAL